MISLFLIIFNQVYESFSYGESSLYMQQMHLITFAGAAIYLYAFYRQSWLKNQLSKLLLNSSLAILVSGCLIKGIIEISGRSTSLEIPYWWAGLIFLLVSILVGNLKPHQ